MSCNLSLPELDKELDKLRETNEDLMADVFHYRKRLRAQTDKFNELYAILETYPPPKGVKWR